MAKAGADQSTSGEDGEGEPADASGRSFPRDVSVHQLFEAVAQRTPVPLALEDARARALNGHRAALLGIHEATGRMRVSSM